VIAQHSFLEARLLEGDAKKSQPLPHGQCTLFVQVVKTGSRNDVGPCSKGPRESRHALARFGTDAVAEVDKPARKSPPMTARTASSVPFPFRREQPTE
jgi:hypothetical protein